MILNDLRLTRCYNSGIPNTMDAMFAMARALALSWPLVALMLKIMDFAHAYRHIGLDPESAQFAVIALGKPCRGSSDGAPEHTALRVS